MKKRYLLTLLLLGVLSVSLNAQNVFNVNDPDVIFTATNQPAAPAFGQIAKWGHAVRLTNWGGTGTTSYKAYYFDGMPFRLKFPKSYQQGVNDGKVYPIFIFFHGAGEAGTIYDNEYQMYWGGKTFRDAVDNGTFDGFVFFEQSSNGYHNAYFPMVSNMIDSLTKYCKVDPNRVIINGLSSGGQGVWDFTSGYPKYIATALPISAARNEYIAPMPGYIHVPMWLFNGGLDNNPDPATAQYVVDTFTHLGGYINHTLYPNLGHGVWNNAWAEPGFWPWVNAAYKSNPLVFFQHTNFCPGDPISAKIAVTPGFYAYQWMKDGVVISGATTNQITATQLGTYSVRIKQNSTSPWSDWSHSPAILTSGAVTPTPAIQINGLHSNVLPAPDGSTTVPLIEPTGYATYKWVHLPDSAIVGTANTFNAAPGTYIAQVKAQFACSSTYSTAYQVVSASGANGADPATNLTVTPVSQTQLQLYWSKNPHPANSETGFEVYRSASSGGPYTLITITPKDTTGFLDGSLNPNTNYYYIVRAVNNNGAGANSNQGVGKTQIDNVPPSAPSALTFAGSTRTSVALTWTASTDNVGVAYYDIYVNGKKSYTTLDGNTTSFVVNNLTFNQTYSFQVKARDAVGNVSPFSNQITANPVANGLTYSYYEGAWTTLPNFNSINPIKVGFSKNVDPSIRNVNTSFGILWQGYINIRKAGTYTFETNSSDGSRLYVGGIGYNPTGTATVNNDGIHGLQSKTANVTLAVGIYPIALAYFKGTSATLGCSLYWTSTANGIARSLIPDSAFVESATIGGSAPAAPSNLVATAQAFNKIRLTWTDNSTNETGFEIYRSTSNVGPFSSVATTVAGAVSFIDSTVSASTTYYYKIRAIGQYGQSAFDAVGIGAPYAYYETPNLSALPNFALLTPIKTGIWPNFTLGMQNNATNFEVKFDTYIKITTAGTYTFYTASDDGSALYINGVRIVNNDGAHGTVTASGTIALTPGSYPITVTYLQIGGGYGLNVYYSGPGLAKTEIPTSVLGNAFASATTPALPPVPAPAYALKATTLTSSVINLTWKDTTNDASGFQIYRFAGSGSFRLITTVANPGGTAFSYNDSSLFDNVMYSYKVAPVGAGGLGAFSNTDSARTLLNNPVITPIANFTMRYGTLDTVAINVIDVDNVPVVLSSPNLPAFAHLTDNANGTGKIIFSPAPADAGTYNNLVIVATASNGGLSSDTFNVVVNNNNPPSLNAIANVAFDEGTKDTIAISATDPDGVTGLVFSSSNLPSFGTLVNNNDGTASLVLNPTYISHGTYTVTITVTDPQGGTSTKSFTLTINKKNPNQSILVRMKYVNTVAAPWNNMTGSSINNLVSTDNITTNVSVHLSPASWWNTYNSGPVTGTNSGVYPDAITQEYFYFGIFGGPDVVYDTIGGLKPGLKYNLKFYSGSAWTGVPDNGSTVFTIGAQAVTLNVQNNTTNTANFTGVAADANGNIIVAMSKAAGTPVGYLNAFEINYLFDDSTAPAKPTNLAANLVPGVGVKLTWNTPAYNALHYDVYRTTDTTTAFTLLNPGASDGNASSYTDSAVVGHTTYYYKIKAVNNYGDLGFTNTVSATTAAKNPTVTGIVNTTVKSNNTVNVAFTATDDPGDNVTVTATLPPFATLQNLGSGSYNIAVSPTSSNVGTYNSSITATDAFGAVTTVPFQIFVVESNVNSVYVHFGTDSSIVGAPWNNFLGYPFGTKSLSGLKSADGSNSGITISLVEQWTNPPVDFGMITGDNSGIFPDIVSRSSLFETSTSPRNITLTGLDVTKKYNLVIFSSVNNGQRATSTFACNGQTVNQDAAYNTRNTVQLNGLTPDATGKLTLTYTKDAASPYGYFNALVIQSYDNTVVPVVSPNSLFVEPVFNSRTTLKLNWADRASNETGFEIWRATTFNGTYSLVTTTAAGVTTYNDASLSSNTQYFYKVRAVNSGIFSDYSNIATATTPANIVLEHTTWHYPEGLRPWNNTAVNPQVGDRYANLRDDQWNNTGLALSILAPFGGEYNLGTSSGNNSYIFPDSVMVSNFWVQNGSQIAVLKLDGLDQSKKYRIGFLGTATWNMDMTAYMTINGVTKYLNAFSNTNKVVYFDGVSPDQNGQVQLTFGAKGVYGLLSALVIMGYTDYGNPLNGNNVGGTAVNNLTASTLGAAANVANGEQHFKVYPNPFRNSFAVTFDNEKGGRKIEIEVYNTAGQLVYKLDGGYSHPGMNVYNVQISQATLQPGIYITRVKTDGKPANVFKLVKLR